MTRARPGTIEALLRDHGLAHVPEEPFPNDGWSSATLTRLRDRHGRAFILKRSSYARDWIAQATHDRSMREFLLATQAELVPWPARYPAIGAAAEDGEVGILMPDLSGILFDWNAVIRVDQLDRVLEALAALHDSPAYGFSSQDMWTGWKDRVSLISRSSLERPGPARKAVATRLLPGWDAWDRLATPGARAVIDGLSEEVQPLLDALSEAPTGLIHGDLKLANAGIAADEAVEMVDWQMVTVAPAAIELGWFLVSNVNALPLPADEVLDRYWRIRRSDPGPENDLAILVGLLLRGWRKGFDAQAGITLASGVPAADDLAWWCERAVAAADRLF